MNPKTSIEPWLRLCSVQRPIGAVEYFEVQAPDMSGKEEEIYFVYTITGATPKPGGEHPTLDETLPVEEGYDVDVAGSQPWQFDLKIELYNSQNGIAELAGCAIAAQTDPDIIGVFQAQHVAYVPGSNSIKNETTRDGERLYYKHVMTCKFNAGAGFTHRKINHKVETITTSFTISQS